jgi:hypothetical protein
MTNVKSCAAIECVWNTYQKSKISGCRRADVKITEDARCDAYEVTENYDMSLRMGPEGEAGLGEPREESK